MNRSIFNENIDSILNDGKIENISIPNIDEIKSIIMDEELNKLLYQVFKKNYESTYGDDTDYIYLKIQDLLYRLHLLINHILIEEYAIKDKNDIYDAVYNYVLDNSILYDSVNYDDSDLDELKDETIYQIEALDIK